MFFDPERTMPEPEPEELTTDGELDEEKLWEQVLSQLEAEGRASPVLENVTLRMEGNWAVLYAPGKAVAWSLEHRQDRIEGTLHEILGRRCRCRWRDVEPQGRWGPDQDEGTTFPKAVPSVHSL